MFKLITLLQFSLFVIIFTSINSIYSRKNGVDPEQIHLSYGTSPSQMIVTWTTLDKVEESYVQYGMDQLSYIATGSVKEFRNSFLFPRITWIHSVLLNDLIPGQKYIYRCGSLKTSLSEVFSFTTMQDGQDWSPRFAVYGDMGSENAQSLPRIQNETMEGMYDAVLHIGDFAYDMVDNDGEVGDLFMNKIQPIAAYLPYMTSVGNHEWAYNFSQYTHRFNMPNSIDGTFGGDNNLFYSFDIGPAHIISFSTEFYYYIEFGFEQVRRQFEWLKQDLMNANKPGNRAIRPWIITMAHRPMYCTNDNTDDCTSVDDRVRKGWPYIQKYGLEDLFFENGVDLEFWAHEHSYERLWPLYNYKVLNGSLEEPYRNPKAPVHIITGSAGCKERHDNFRNMTYFSAFRSDDYGYTRMQVFNSSHLYLEQVSDDQNGKVIDNIWIIKDKHGPFRL